jgi:hypothetical protein
VSSFAFRKNEHRISRLETSDDVPNSLDSNAFLINRHGIESSEYPTGEWMTKQGFSGQVMKVARSAAADANWIEKTLVIGDE